MTSSPDPTDPLNPAALHPQTPLQVNQTREGYLDLRGSNAPQINLTSGNTQNVHLPPPPPPTWPVPPVGRIPGLASAFQPRPGLRQRIADARAGGQGNGGGGVVLTQTTAPGAGSSGQVLSGGGGVGKSQLAASCAAQAIGDETDLVVWVNASTSDGVITAYAQAAARVQAPGASGQPGDVEVDARAFLDWVAGTNRSWLVVLDDITDPDYAAAWWPVSYTGTGWVLATTRRRDPVLTGAGRQVVDVDVYEVDEAITYLTQRLSNAGKAHLFDERASDLAEALGYLPLALSHATAYMIAKRATCSEYLDLYTAGMDKLDELMPGDPDGHGRTPDGHTRRITITLLLSLAAADADDPVGLARPAMDLTAVLDPTGHPEALWATDSVCTYLTARTLVVSGEAGNPAEPVTLRQARDALLLLDQYGLVALDEQAEPRAVRIHALTARATRETTPAQRVADATRVAADAVLTLWPDAEHGQPELTATLRVNAATLATHAGDALWTPKGAHPLIQLTGWSFIDAGLHTAALSFTRRVAADATRLLGPNHPDALATQVNLGASYFLAGHIREAVALLESAVATTRQLLGPDNPHTIKAQLHLAFAYAQAGRRSEAAALLETVVTVRTRLLGPDDVDTLAAQRSLGTIYAEDGRTGEAIALLEPVTHRMVQVLGPDDAGTLNAQASLALAYLRAGRPDDAASLLEPVVAKTRQLLGPDHPETLQTQSNLAAAYRQTGHTEEAIALLEAVADSRLRLVGAEHPGTLNVQHNLAAAYRQAGRADEAVALMEQVVNVAVRALGPEHPNTLTTRIGLAYSYLGAGRDSEGITLLQQVAADRMRILGPAHPDTVAVVSMLWKMGLW